MTPQTSHLGSPLMPVFVLELREIESGLVLAGQLVVDIPKRPTLKRRYQQLIIKILEQLAAAAKSGQMPNEGLTIGWRGGSKPLNAVDTDNVEIMTAWARRSVKIDVRIDSRDGGDIWIDSDMVRQLGLQH